LPSITEIAKWSLITGKYFVEAQTVSPLREVFHKCWGEIAFYSSDANISELKEQLKAGVKKLYCWDTTELDKKYHDSVDYPFLVQSVKSYLDALSAMLVELHGLFPDPEGLKMVISGDHGQLMGYSEVLSKKLMVDDVTGGRVTFEKPTSEEDFLYLKADRFGLHKDCWILANDFNLGAKKTEKGLAVGVHGGVFPEEILVGCSVLKMNVSYTPLHIEVSGSGINKVGGDIEFKISNKNGTSAENLVLIIDELSHAGGRFTIDKIGPNRVESFKFNTSEWLSPTGIDKVNVTGICRYNFVGREPVYVEIKGHFECQEIYSKIKLPDDW
jgi:hypothetical protein